MSDKKPERRGLGRGLSALMADVMPDPGADQRPRRPDLSVPVEKLEPNPDQPRRDFPVEALEELAASLRARGMIQPIIVRPHPRTPGGYEIVAGERRWRAAQMAQMHDVPVLLRDLDDTEVLEIAIIENIQRAELNALEEAHGYRQLMDRFGHTQEKLAEALSKSRSHIANLLRLLTLPDTVQAWLREGKLTAGHARALITAEDPIALAKEVIARGLSVRDTEQLARTGQGRSTTGGSRVPKVSPKDADTRALEQDLSANLGMKVVIDHKGLDGGALTVNYRSLDDLDRLCQMLSSLR
jgi:ParB family chromosome partitioning protein